MDSRNDVQEWHIQCAKQFDTDEQMHEFITENKFYETAMKTLNRKLDDGFSVVRNLELTKIAINENEVSATAIFTVWLEPSGTKMPNVEVSGSL